MSALLMGFTNTIQAQEEDVNARLDKIEKITSKLPKIAGILNFRYRYDDANHTNRMDVRRARLDFTGNISSSVDYRLLLEFTNTPKILDANIRWKINPYLNLQAGQFKFPFSLENQYSPQKLETIDYSSVITYLGGWEDVSGISSNARDVGIQLTGGFIKREGYNIISYGVGLFNGSGINVTDNNQSKDFSGILSINPIKPLTIAVSHYNGSTGPQGATHQRVRTGGGIKYDNAKLIVRSEYIQGTSTAIDATGNPVNLNSDGFYALLGYCFAQKVQPVVKYDYWRRNKDVHDNLQQAYLIGVNYFPIRNIELQLNYTYRKNINTEDSNYVALQLWAHF
jgi:hypothetical protein